MYEILRHLDNNSSTILLDQNDSLVNLRGDKIQIIRSTINKGPRYIKKRLDLQFMFIPKGVSFSAYIKTEIVKK